MEVYGFYGYPERGRRRDSWNLLRNLADKSLLPWCIIGDFNDLMNMEEKKGENPHPKYLWEGFANTVNECGLIDLGFLGDKFTWEKWRGSSRWVQERLDRGLATQSWKDLFPLAKIQVLEVSTSDHLPLYLSLNKKVYVPRGRRFRFENIWIRERDCVNVIRGCWNKEGAEDITVKLLHCCAKLEEWGGGLVKEMRAQLRECRDKLRKLRSRRDTQGISEYKEVS